jgi:hypothetical protein
MMWCNCTLISGWTVDEAIFTTSSDWTNDWTGTTHLLIDQITELLPSEMTGHIDFEKSSIHFVHFCILGEGRLGEENVSNLMLDTYVPLKGI